MTLALSLRALDTDVVVACEDAAVHAALHAVTASYPRAIGAPKLHYQLASSDGSLCRNGLAIGFHPTPAALAGAFEVDLVQQVVELAEPSFLLHSAAVVVGRGAMLLFGESGAGKTTMARALVARGAKYITDEFSAIDRALTVRGIPRPLNTLNLPQGSREDQLRGEIHRYRLEGTGGIVELRLLALAGEHIHRTRTPITAVIHLRHAPHESPTTRRLSPLEGLERLWSERHRFGAHELEIAVDLVREVGVTSVVTRTVSEACDAVTGLTPPGEALGAPP